MRCKERHKKPDSWQHSESVAEAAFRLSRLRRQEVLAYSEGRSYSDPDICGRVMCPYTFSHTSDAMALPSGSAGWRARAVIIC